MMYALWRIESHIERIRVNVFWNNMQLSDQHMNNELHMQLAGPAWKVCKIKAR